MDSPSNFANGNSIGAEPDARITCLASMTSGSPSGGVNSTFLPASNLPWPTRPSTLFALKRPPMPPVNCRDNSGATLLHSTEIELHAAGLYTVVS